LTGGHAYRKLTRCLEAYLSTVSVGNTTKIVSWLFYLAVLVETFLLSGVVPNAFTVPKAVAALVGAALLCPVVLLSYRRVPRIFLLQFAVLSACTILSLNSQVSFWGADWRRMGLITWIAILVAGAAVPIVIDSSKLRWTHFLRFITATGGIAATYGILQWLNLDPLLPLSLREKLIEEFGGAYRAIGTIGQPNYFANYLQYPLFCAIALLRFDSDRRWRRFSGVGVAILSAALMMSMSRGAIAGAVLGLLLLGFTTPNRRRFAAAVALAAVLFSVSGFLVLQSPSYGKQLQSRIDYIWNDTTGGGRLVLWQDVAERLLPKFWLTGTGLGMFRPAFAEVRSDRYAAYSPDVHWETAHNVFLDRWTEQGLAGLIVFIVLIGITGANIRSAFRNSRDPREKWAIAAISAAFVSACFGNLFNGETIPTAYYFCLWVGFSYATKACFGAGADRVQPLASSRFRVCAVTASALLSCAFIWHAKNNWLAETYLAKAGQAATTGDDVLLLQAATASVDAFPESGVYSLEVTDLILRAATKLPATDARRHRLVQTGIEFGMKATSGDKSFLAYYYISELGNLINDPRTEDWLRTVIERDPYWFRPHRLLASWLARKQRFTDAGAEARTALHLAQYDATSAALVRQIEDVQQVFGDKKSVESYGRLPLTFEENRGQFDARADFVARSKGYSIFLSGSRAVLALRSPKK
jgi:O-antigen ligase